MRIAVAGGTGVVGRYAVAAAQAAGHEAVVMSRARGVDVRTGAGLADALEGVQVIVDATNSATGNGAKSAEFFVEVTRQLETVGAAQGVGRLVTLSIVGVDRVTGYGYYQAKVRQEEAARTGALPVRIVRATQFHEFPGQVLARTKFGPLAMVPRMQVQPVAARSVGQVLVEVAAGEGPPAPTGATKQGERGEQGETVEVAGPEVHELVQLTRKLLRSRHRRVAVVPLPVPGAAGRAMRGDALLAGRRTRIVGPTFDEWLASDDAR